MEDLFASALVLPQRGRADFLRRQCADDASLQEEVLELLESHQRDGALDAPLTPIATTAMAPSLSAGVRVGAWRIGALIGRGGMGEVYAAVRDDGVFEQKAALKLLRFEAARELDRFHAERRILARLEHPGIARLLDGGLSPDGRPYTVMEYVDGRSITLYCAEQRLRLRDRLMLFSQVCDAVAFAHRNLVIHRDLKPDNILVDADGTVKLLDFGIAKLIDVTAASSEGDLTRAPFTPDYAAPEQVSGQAVTTATDVYALGVLLFEMLAGERPLRTRGLPSAQVLRLVLEQTAPSPSRVARTLPNAPLPANLLSGDLDAIVAKCLRKEERHRYETVDALKHDVQRHLRQEPVLARDGARLYVFGSLLRRYRWPVAAGVVLLLALLVGLAGTIWQSRRAQTEAERATAVLGFVEGLFEGADPATSKGESITAHELLDLGAARVDGEFAGQPELRAQLKHTVGRLYLKLGLLDRAKKELGTALELTSVTALPQARFERLLDRARVDRAEGSTDAGLVRLDEAAPLVVHLPDAARGRIELAGLRAQLLHQRGDDAAAIVEAGEAYANAVATLGADHRDALDAAESYAELLADAGGRFREALPLVEQVVAARVRSLGRDHPRTLEAQTLLAGVLRNVGDLPRATGLATEVLERRRIVLGERHPDTALSLTQVGNMLYAAGRYADADVPLRQAIDVLRTLEPTDRNLLALTLYNEATSAYFQGHMEEAERGYRESAELWTALYGPDHRDALSARMALAQLLRRKGQAAEAIGMLTHILEVRDAVGGDTVERFETLRALGDAQSANADHAEAIAHLIEAEQMAVRLFGKDNENPQQARALLGRAYFAAGDAPKAAEVSEVALAALRKLHPEGHPDIARTQGYLARIELRLGDARRAQELSREQYDFVRAQFPEADNPRVAEAQALHGECLLANGQQEAGSRALESAIDVLERVQPQHPQLAEWRRLLRPAR